MKNQYLRFALLASLTLTSISALAQCAEAQILNKLRGDYGGDSQIQYSPDDPSTRNRLFNLQTGHAGAFYNCDGEEDKRNSPFICWQNGPCKEKFHCTFLDVLDWRRDKNEIAQRICDGAGACCNSGNCNVQTTTVISTPAPCGCAECLAAKATKALSPTSVAGQKKPTMILQRVHASSKTKTKVASQTQVGGGVVGLVSKSASSVLEQAKPKAVPCNCAECRAKRAAGTAGNAKVATKAPASKPAATSRSASLLDRARSSRKQR